MQGAVTMSVSCQHHPHVTFATPVGPLDGLWITQRTLQCSRMAESTERPVGGDLRAAIETGYGISFLPSIGSQIEFPHIHRQLFTAPDQGECAQTPCNPMDNGLSVTYEVVRLFHSLIHMLIHSLELWINPVDTVDNSQVK